jgi:hypothetical protein
VDEERAGKVILRGPFVNAGSGYLEAIAKLNNRCLPRESGGPEIIEKTGFPLSRE